MTRLTRYTREYIIEAALAFSFDQRTNTLATVEDALAREAYAVIFPKKETELVAKVPENWFRLDGCLQFNVGGQTIVLKTTGERLPVPYRQRGSDSGSYNCHTLGVIQPGDLCDRIQEHAQNGEKLKEERYRARNQLRTMLGDITSIKKLSEIWPEGEPFYSKYRAKPAPQVPAVRIEEINSLLGLSQVAAAE